MDNVTSRRVRATVAAVGNPQVITYSECVYVPLSIQHAKCKRSTNICGLSGFTIFFKLYLMNVTTFVGGGGGY
jgi:hypothetical protein